MSCTFKGLLLRAAPWVASSILLASTASHAVTIYTEVGDAGELPSTAQTTTDSTQAFDEIKGNLTPNAGDSVDMFKIFITGGGDFSAETIGGVSFDSELYLFDSTGHGVYANDDTTGFLTPSLLPANNALTPVASGFYYLAISQCCHQPFSASGAIFSDVDGGAGHLLLSGPTGAGGSSAVTSFSGNFDQNPGGGAYTIFLTGAVVAPTVPAVPEPDTYALMAGGLALLGWSARRRRD